MASACYCLISLNEKNKKKRHGALTHYHTMPHLCIRYIAVENIVRKGENACNKQFFLFSLYFVPYMALIFHFKCTFKCRLQFGPVWTCLKFCCLVMG